MKIYLYISLIAVLMLVGCDTSDKEYIGEITTCELYPNISYPGVWQFRMYEFPGKDVPFHTHFVDEFQGYVAGNSTDYNQAYAQKTDDGGLSWNTFPMSFHEPATAFCFYDENFSFVGVEQQPGGHTRLARSGDGGITWSVVEYEELNGNLVDLHFLNEEIGYAILQSNDSLERVSMLRTNDAGQSWDEIFYNPSLIQVESKLSMTMTDNFIYRVGAGGDIYQLDHSGQMINNIEVPETEIFQLQVVADNILIIVTGGGLYISQDAGLSWTMRMGGDIKVGAFFDADNGLAVQNSEYCPSEVYHAHDRLAATQDQGASWVKGTLTSNLLVDLADRELVNSDLAVCLFKNRLVFCSR